MTREIFARPNVGMSAIAGFVLLVLSTGCPRTTVWFGADWANHDAGSDAGSAADGEHHHPRFDGGIDSPDGGVGQGGGDGSAGATSMMPSMHAGAGAGGSAGQGGAAASGAAGKAGDAAAGSGAMASGSGAGGAGQAGGAAAMSGREPRLPKAPEPCPKLASGIVKMLGQDVQLWVGEKSATQRGAVLVYWHAAGSTPTEATTIFGAAVMEIVSQGGIVAAPVTSTGKGTNTGASMWYTGDFEIADEVAACAIEQLAIDTRRIYTIGGSMGGLQAGDMVYQRSGYVAAAVLNSGGSILTSPLQDPLHVPAVITLHGSKNSDVVIIDFATASVEYGKSLKAAGGYAVDCDHNGGHMASPQELTSASWQFLKDHPFGITPEPYGTKLPVSFPKYCKIQ